MTNEQLAAFIKQDSPELIPVLWERIRKLMYAKAKQFYSQRQSLCDRCGVTVEDIKQECYPAFVDALNAYAEEKDCKFTSFLGYPFQNHMNSLTGQRTNAAKQAPLNNSSSLDEPLKNADGDECTRLHLIPDESSIVPFSEYEESETQRILHEEISKLPEQYRAVIQLRYFKEKTLNATGAILSISRERVRQAEARALRMLRRSNTLRRMYGEFRRHYTWNRVAHFENSPQYFEMIQELQERERRGEYISYGKKQATIYSACQKYDESVES